MSLSSLLEQTDIRVRLRQDFPKPRLGARKELLARPLIKRYGLVGTAFDYWLRFRLQRLNPNAQDRSWIAEQDLQMLGGGLAPFCYV